MRSLTRGRRRFSVSPHLRRQWRRTRSHPEPALSCLSLSPFPPAHLCRSAVMHRCTQAPSRRPAPPPSSRVLRTRSLVSAEPALLGTDRAGERTDAPHRFWDFFGPAHSALRHTCTWTGTPERRFYRTSKSTAQRPRRFIRSLLPPSPLFHVARFLPSRSSPF